MNSGIALAISEFLGFFEEMWTGICEIFSEVWEVFEDISVSGKSIILSGAEPRDLRTESLYAGNIYDTGLPGSLDSLTLPRDDSICWEIAAPVNGLVRNDKRDFSRFVNLLD